MEMSVIVIQRIILAAKYFFLEAENSKSITCNVPLLHRVKCYIEAAVRDKETGCTVHAA